MEKLPQVTLLTAFLPFVHFGPLPLAEMCHGLQAYTSPYLSQDHALSWSIVLSGLLFFATDIQGKIAKCRLTSVDSESMFYISCTHWHGGWMNKKASDEFPGTPHQHAEVMTRNPTEH